MYETFLLVSAEIDFQNRMSAATNKGACLMHTNQWHKRQCMQAHSIEKV